MRAVTGSGGRLHFGMVAGIKSERWPTSNRNPWPDCVGIRTLGVGVRQNILAADLVVEGVEAVAGFCLRFRVQRRLQFLNAIRS